VQKLGRETIRFIKAVKKIGISFELSKGLADIPGKISFGVRLLCLRIRSYILNVEFENICRAASVSSQDEKQTETQRAAYLTTLWIEPSCFQKRRAGNYEAGTQHHAEPDISFTKLLV
jgi:hypothetical protein